MGGMREEVRQDRQFGVLLRQFRGLRGLTQVELAERSGLNVQAISMLERGVRRAPRSTTVEFLAEALKLDAQERDALVSSARGASTQAALPHDTLESERQPDAVVGLAGANALLAALPAAAVPPREPLPAGSRMPLAPNPLFVGRGNELLQIAAALKDSNTTVALGQVVASTGLGGLGKTQLAVELVHRYGRFFAGGVFWLSFGSVDEIPLQVAACGGPDAMDLAPGVEALPLEERVKRVQRAWQHAVPRLLVFDNCEEEELLEAWRPVSGGCRVLVTSRRSHWSPTLGVTAFALDLLPRLDSIGLLRRYRPDLAADDPGLDAIANELGDLPLALHLAGSYLRIYRAEVSLDDYLTELRRADIVGHASLLGAGLYDSISATHHVQGVAQTFALCLGRLDREHEVDRIAIALLARLACMAPGEPVPRDLLAMALEDVDPLRRADGLRRLGTVGLMEEGAGWLRLHRLMVHFVRKENLDSRAQDAVDKALIECGRATAELNLTGASLLSVIPHAVDVASRDAVDSPRLAMLCNAAGLMLQYAADLTGASYWLERALQIRERVLEPGDAAVADSLNNLAVLLMDKGDFASAQPLQERGLSICERVYGLDHLDTVNALSNLGLILWKQGDLVNARLQFERAVPIVESIRGPNHRDTAGVLNNLANVLRDDGELVAARGLYERVLDIAKQTLGSEHSHTATALNNLARLLQRQGDLAGARLLIERSLAIRERVLGSGHTHTAVSVHDLATVLNAQCDPAAARRLFERALSIRERVLGRDHRDTVATRRALAGLDG